MNATLPVSREIVAHDFVNATYGKLDSAKIASAVETLKATTTAYPATGSVASFIFYLQFQVQITNGKTFNGKAGGISSAGGGALFGDVYTGDLNRLYSDTVSFQFIATPVYLSIQFFDRHSNLLGTFQSGAVSTVAGTGGGTGGW
jgi:hypothetical protein